MNSNYKPIAVGDTANLPNNVWLEWRKHGPKGDIPYTLGGSDVAAVFGVSPWVTPLELWKIKHGDMEVPEKTNKAQLEMGHLLEPLASHFFAEKEGLYVYDDTNMYQHPNYPWALADVDRRYFTEDGEDAILECKSTSFHKRDSWANYDKGNIAPYYYELQLRYYMGIFNVNHGAFVCIWGSNPDNDMAIVYIERDLEIEEMIFKKCQAFIDSLYAGVPPKLEGVDPTLAIESLKKIYAQGDKNLPEVEFGRKQEAKLRKLKKVSEKLTTSKAAVKELEEEFKKESVEIIEILGEHEKGTLRAKDGTLYTVTYPTTLRTTVDSTRLKKEYPEIWEATKKVTSSRTFKIKTQ